MSTPGQVRGHPRVSDLLLLGGPWEELAGVQEGGREGHSQKGPRAPSTTKAVGAFEDRPCPYRSTHRATPALRPRSPAALQRVAADCLSPCQDQPFS